MRFLVCVSRQHDWRILILAVAVCALTAVAGMGLFSKLPAFPPRVRRVWLGLIGLVIGSGVWSTHFVAMLAFEPGVSAVYDPTLTVASLLVAFGSSYLAFDLASAAPPGRLSVRAGCALGAGVALMHYVGMAALRTGGFAFWDPAYVVLSVAIGVGLAIPAMSAARPGASLGRQLGAATLLAAGICGLHLVGMTAVTIVPGARSIADGAAISRSGLAIAVAGLTVLVVLVVFGALLLDAWRRRRFHEQVREVVDGVLDGLAIFDADDRLIAWNERYEAVAATGQRPLAIGMTGAQVVETLAACDGSFGPDACKAWAESRRLAFAGGCSSFEHRFADGRWLRIDHRSTVRRGVVTVFVDVTELKRQAEALARALDAAEAATRAKSEFLANISHEIRTPMNGVLGVLRLLEARQRPARADPLVKEALACGEMLQALLDDVIDLSRLERGELDLAIEPTDANTVARGVAEMVRPAAERKGLALVLELGTVPECTMASSVRLRQSLLSLVTNAVKFTEHGRVTLRTSLCAGPAGERLRFEVEDTGIGVRGEDQERIFERFEQVDTSATRRFDGAGLGLPIARKLARMMGGDVGCVSAPGVGSTFWLEIPAVEALKPPETAAGPGAGLDGVRVLVVEDNATNRLVVVTLLESMGASVQTAVDGETGVAAALAGDFDLILMDIQMPGVDGLEATRRLRRSPGRCASTPVIALTANALSHQCASYYAAGMDGVVSKPIAPARLLAEITRLLDAPGAEVRRQSA
jgi:signal transduction histidine kinase/NO-binding membrane sensor protein with MHYT domain